MRFEAVVLPDLGCAPAAPLVVSGWHARRGERVIAGERLVEVLAGPAVIDVAAPCSGTVARVLRRVDDPIAPGEVLGYLAVSEDAFPRGIASKPEGDRA